MVTKTKCAGGVKKTFWSLHAPGKPYYRNDRGTVDQTPVTER